MATPAQTRRYAARLLRRHARPMRTVLALHGLAEAAGLTGPLVFGRIVDRLLASPPAAGIDLLVTVLAAALVVRVTLTWIARRASLMLAETVFADLREEFLAAVARLPLSTVERAGSGDLVARTTNDIEEVSHSVRYAVPRILIASVSVGLTLIALILTGPLIAPAVLVAVPLLWAGTRWYLARARDGYLRERAGYAALDGTVGETVDAALTVSALGLAGRRQQRVEQDLRAIMSAELYTLRLRTVWFPLTELSYVLPLVAVLGWGGFLALHGQTGAGQVTAMALYVVQLIEPLDDVLSWLDELQVGGASLARVVGVGEVPDDRRPTGGVPVDEVVRTRGLRYAYRPGHDVLHGIDLTLRPGERLAVVGPSGAGKSTLGRLLAGIHPPTAGTATVGGVPLVDLPLEQLRGHVALVTQEHHVFVGTLTDNLLLSRPDAGPADLEAALAAVDALAWARSLPQGLVTPVGSGGHRLTPAQAQQLALARLVLADPHTLVLDEATSLLDPRTARHLERSLSGVLAGRTVVAVAHRLHTAHDADRVAVVEGGRVTEIGPHADLVARDGSYAALWRSWRQEAGPRQQDGPPQQDRQPPGAQVGTGPQRGLPVRTRATRRRPAGSGHPGVSPE